MQIDILSLFPEMFTGPLKTSIIGRARENGLLQVEVHNIRDHALDKHRIVDSTPYGGGAGMVLKPDVVVRAIEHIQANSQAPVIYLSPQGKQFTQQTAERLSQLPELILLCGHYEGLDERVKTKWIDEEISIGDYVLTGGELPALVVIDAVSRLLPGVLGHEDSAQFDSFQDGLLEHPHYTRPATFRGMNVPEVLLSGHHENIRLWRLKEALRTTFARRPDLIASKTLTLEEQKLLQDIKTELGTC